MNIRKRLVFGSVLGVLLPVAATSALIGYIATSVSREALVEQARNNLVSVRNNKQQQIEAYFTQLRDQIKTFSNDRMIIEAMREFRGAYSELEAQPDSADYEQKISAIRDYYQGDFSREYQRFNGDRQLNMSALLGRLDPQSVELQYQYIANNPNPLGSKDELQAGDDAGSYAGTHQKYHPHIRDYLKTFGYYDIFLAHPESGDIIYSVYKEIDFSTSLVNGTFAPTGIGVAFRQANAEGVSPEQVFVTDFATYLPSYEQDAGFLASPIYDGNEKLGVLIFQAPIDRINSIMTSNREWSEVGLGESGETYLVAQDETMRNDSRFLIEDREAYLAAVAQSGFATEVARKNTTFGLQTVRTPGSTAALAGETGFQIFPDYRGVAVLSAYTPLSLPGLNWALMSEIDEAEAFQPADRIRNFTVVAALIVAAIVLALAGIAAFRLIRGILNPLQKLQTTVSKVAHGDMQARSQLVTGDELQELGDAFDNLLNERIASLANAEQENEQLNESVVSLIDAVSRLSERDLTVKVPVAEDVTGAVADAMNLMAKQTAQVLNDINRISEQVVQAVDHAHTQGRRVDELAGHEREILAQTIARLDTAVTTMTTIDELARKCNELASGASASTDEAANSVARTASGIVEIRETIAETEKRMKRLGERSQEINAAVEIIKNIAERTHVLALNASMQAAAAGEAGRGFAVVADEVQRLAESSRESTSQIAALVSNIQTETSETMANMQKTIGQVVEGSELATQAGTQMNATRQKTEDLAKVVAQIAQTSVEQAQVSQQLRSQAAEIDTGAQETAEAIELQTEQTNKLRAAAEALRQAVGVFKLPEKASAPRDDLAQRKAS